MSNQEGGAAIDLVIVTTVIIVFLFMPLLTFALEKLIIGVTINRAVELMESSLYSMSEAVELVSLSTTEITYDTDKLSLEFNELFSKELGGVADVEVVTLEFYPFKHGPLPCQPSRNMTYDTLHVELEITYERKFYRKLLDNLSENRLCFHYDLEIPRNN